MFVLNVTLQHGGHRNVNCSFLFDAGNCRETLQCVSYTNVEQPFACTGNLDKVHTNKMKNEQVFV